MNEQMDEFKSSRDVVYETNNVANTLDSQSNNGYLEMANADESRGLYATIRKRLLLLFGYLMRREIVEILVTNGNISGRRGRLR